MFSARHSSLCFRRCERLRAAGVVCLVDAVAKVLGISMTGTPGLLALGTCAGFSASICLYLAFVAREPLAWLRDPQPE